MNNSLVSNKILVVMPVVVFVTVRWPVLKKAPWKCICKSF